MLSVVLINWNGWGDTIACIQSLLNSDTTNARIIVIDNNSSDCSIEVFQRWSEGAFELMAVGDDIEMLALNGRERRRNSFFTSYKNAECSFSDLDFELSIGMNSGIDIYFVKSDHNGGFGYGCNIGMRLGRKLGSSAYWLLNNDCVVNPAALGLMNENIRVHPYTIFGAILRYYYRPALIQAVGGGTFCRITGRNKLLDKLPLRRPLDFINGASCAFSSECLDRVGEFDEKIFMYFEEIDFCVRANLYGYRCDVIQTDVYHKHGGSQGKVSTIGAWKQVLVNKHYVLKKHIGWGVWMIFFYTMLLFRCTLPIGEKNARLGARQALKRLVFGGEKA